MLVGHEHLVKDFKNLIKAGRLAHGYIFFGEPEVGKFYFAKHLANFLENGKLELATRPLQDVLVLGDPSTRASTELSRTSSGQAGIDDMRRIKNFLWRKPVVSSKRIVVINNAGNLTLRAQNSILKITEEPPENSVLILIASRPENLLPALLSRLQKIYFGRLSDSEMEKVVSDRQIIVAAFGRPGRAVRLLKDELTAKAEQYSKNFLEASGRNRSGLIKELVDSQRDLTDEEGKESMFLDYFFESLILKLWENPKKNCGILRSVLHRLFLIKSYNTNKRLQLEAIAN